MAGVRDRHFAMFAYAIRLLYLTFLVLIPETSRENVTVHSLFFGAKVIDNLLGYIAVNLAHLTTEGPGFSNMFGS